MVDSVKNAISRIDTPKAQHIRANGQQPAHEHRAYGVRDEQKSVAALARQNNADLKSSEISAQTQILAATAPMDMDKVNQIKSAIKDGKYPIDIERVADALLEAYRDMKS